MPHEHDREVPPPPGIPPYRSVSLVLGADGAVRSAIRATELDGPIPVDEGASVSWAVARLTGTAPEPERWDRHLAALRANPMTCVSFAVTIAAPESAPLPLKRLVVANPIAGADGALESILLRLDAAHEVGALPDPDEDRFRFLAETLPTMLWMARPDGSIEYMSPQWERFTGIPVSQLVTEGYYSIIHPDDLDNLGMLGATEGEDGEYTMPPFRLRQADGGYRWVQATIKSVRGDQGELLRVVGITTDVTHRRSAEDTRRALTEQLRAALTVSGMGRYELNLDAGTATGDDQTCEILGIEPGGEGATMSAAQVFSMVYPEDLALVRSATDAALADRSGLHVECRIVRPSDGGPQVRWVAVLGRVEQDDDSLRIFGVLGDVTERRAEDAARLRSQKREAIGTLAGGIAHDFNNVISAIWSNATVAETEIKAGISPATSIHEIRRGAERAADVVQRLLSFSREEEPVRKPFDLAAVAREACELVRPTLAAGVALEAPEMTQTASVLGSSSQLHQVVVNLVGNAGHAAADGGGHITVLVDTFELPRSFSGFPNGGGTTTLPAGRYARLRVRDDGPGIPADVMPKIFDPFFTTKAAGQGTGLGLAASQSIVRSHGGDISADNLLGGPGAELTVLLPANVRRVADLNDDRPAAEAGTQDGPPSPRVLFVDDDPALARLAARGLPLHGCVVTPLTDSNEALELLRADPSAFDALVVDLSMPGLTGLDLIEAARQLRPDLALVLSSGYLTRENRDRAERLGVGAILPKPCSLDAIVAAIHELTAASADPRPAAD